MCQLESAKLAEVGNAGAKAFEFTYRYQLDDLQGRGVVGLPMSTGPNLDTRRVVEAACGAVEYALYKLKRAAYPEAPKKIAS